MTGISAWNVLALLSASTHGDIVLFSPLSFFIGTDSLYLAYYNLLGIINTIRKTTLHIDRKMSSTRSRAFFPCVPEDYFDGQSLHSLYIT